MFFFGGPQVKWEDCPIWIRFWLTLFANWFQQPARNWIVNFLMTRNGFQSRSFAIFERSPAFPAKLQARTICEELSSFKRDSRLVKDLQFDLYIIYQWKIWYVTHNFALEIFPKQLHVLRWSSFRTFLRWWSFWTKMATRTHQKSQRSPRCARLKVDRWMELTWWFFGNNPHRSGG